MPYYFIPILVMFLIILTVNKRNKLIVVQRIIKRIKTREIAIMIELAKKFIDKECIVYSFDGHQFEGVIKEVEGGALLIEKNGALEAINLDFVLRIREYPKNKNGKKKALVLD